eukprot:TRINITY_DN489_c0_g1_i1.p1 TRINITY_DN489_c0_g1~~TRINITY_DN489_c0_g1_i1.p1  ORF type:complete len:514 (-),score=227.56 TRINITY_DN489_c0_g1_i1:347-1888(-)
MIINHIDKIFVTSDAATIMKEMEVQHPAAKLIVMASKMQESESGDGTNFVVTFAGELLSQAESLIKMGLHPSQIVLGYEQAQKKAIEILESLSCFTVTDPRNEDQVVKCLRSAISSKLHGLEDFFTGIIAKACIQTLPKNVDNFDVEYVRVAKILGSNIQKSEVIRGLVVTRNAEGSIKSVTNPRIAVYACPLDSNQAETKGTVLLKNAAELLNYTKSEESYAENIVKTIAEAGVNLLVVGGTVSDLMLHYTEKYKLMVVKLTSKFELKRLCKCLSAIPLVKLVPPTAEEWGSCDEVVVEEIGSQKVTVFRRETEDCRLSTIVLRGSTNNLLDDLERAVDDGVNVFRNLLRDSRFVPGAGATEMTLATRLEAYANTFKGLEQYSINRFAKSFEIIPRILTENAGLNANTILTKLTAANSGTNTAGLDIVTGEVKDSASLGILDHLLTKLWAIRLASDAALTVLRVDQIIIAKPAGGPKMRAENKNWDAEEQKRGTSKNTLSGARAMVPRKRYM